MVISRRLQTYILSTTVAMLAIATIACTATPAASPPTSDPLTPSESVSPTPDPTTQAESLPPTPGPSTLSESPPPHLDRSTPPDSLPPPPVRPVLSPRPLLTPEEELEQVKEEFEEIKDRIFYISGPHTAGGLIRVAGRDVRLPPDAFVAHRIDTILCVVGSPCPEAPYYVIQRGNSSVAVSVGSGIAFGENVEPGEEGVFDFLKAVLP